jgi:hypothetical protein
MIKTEDMPAMIEPPGWSLSDDRQSVRFHIPPLPIAGLSEPLRLHLDFDAEALDEMLKLLSVLRVQMLPPLSAARN